MDSFDKSEMPYHIHIYRRFITSVRYIVLAPAVAATFIAFTFFIGAGSWIAGLFLAAIVLAIGLYFISHTPVHPHAAFVQDSRSRLRRREMTESG
jgi:hypothetical protein